MPVFWSSILSPPPKFHLGFFKASWSVSWRQVRLFCAYPCTLPSNELIILSLDASSASDVEILSLKVRIIQLFRSLRKKHSGRVKLQISWLWKSTRTLFFKQTEWKSVEVKIIPCFQQEGKCRDCVQLWTRVTLCAWLLLVNTTGIPRTTAVTKQLRFVSTLMHWASERQKKVLAKRAELVQID